MLIGVPRERLDNESRVAATPKTVQQILKLGFDVIVEHDAGFKASFEDQAFVAAGAKVGDAAQVWQADIIFKVNAPTDDEIALIKEGATLVSFIWPAQNPQLMENCQRKNQCVGDGCRATYFSCASIGCIKFNGKYCRLSCRGGSRT